jgi:hypothetical protein
MNKTAKLILAGITIATLAGSAHAFGGGRDCGDWGGPMMGGKNSERMTKMHDTRMAALHDKLKLSDKQEGAWKKFSALPPVMGNVTRPDPKELDKLNAPQRLEKGLEHMRTMETKMAEHLAALKEFYAVLTPEQQKIFDEQMPTPGERKGYRR